MIKKEKLIEALRKIINEDTEKEIEKFITTMHMDLDYKDQIETIQDIIKELGLSFWVEELMNNGAIAYQQRYFIELLRFRLYHLGDLAMEYNSIDELLEELNSFQEQCI